MNFNFPPEIESGNIEYKLKIIPESNKRTKRLMQLSTQLKWRVMEGRGLAIYILGITDKGKVDGLSTEEFKNTLDNLRELVALNKFSIIQKNINQTPSGKFWASIIILGEFTSVVVTNYL